MKVRLRHHEDARGLPFCEIAPTREAIEALFNLLGTYEGVLLEGGARVYPTNWQFVIDDEAYLEIILGGEPE